LLGFTLVPITCTSSPPLPPVPLPSLAPSLCPSLSPSVPFSLPPFSLCLLTHSLPSCYLLPSLHETRNALSVSEKTARSKLEEVQLGRSSAEADLAIEKQWRASLQVGGCAHVDEYVLVSEYGSNGTCTSLRSMWGSGECVCTMY